MSSDGLDVCSDCSTQTQIFNIRQHSKFDPNNKAVVKLEKQKVTAQVVLPPQSHIGRPVTKPDVVN